VPPVSRAPRKRRCRDDALRSTGRRAPCVDGRGADGGGPRENGTGALPHATGVRLPGYCGNRTPEGGGEPAQPNWRSFTGILRKWNAICERPAGGSNQRGIAGSALHWLGRAPVWYCREPALSFPGIDPDDLLPQRPPERWHKGFRTRAMLSVSGILRFLPLYPGARGAHGGRRPIDASAEIRRPLLGRLGPGE
jgi:hypothetical protein